VATLLVPRSTRRIFVLSWAFVEEECGRARGWPATLWLSVKEPPVEAHSTTDVADTDLRRLLSGESFGTTSGG
jgi:hypothetical protein